MRIFSSACTLGLHSRDDDQVIDILFHWFFSDTCHYPAIVDLIAKGRDKGPGEFSRERSPVRRVVGHHDPGKLGKRVSLYIHAKQFERPCNQRQALVQLVCDLDRGYCSENIPERESLIMRLNVFCENIFSAFLRSER